ncbi:MAG TPA: hypothetical protein VNN74_06590 [Candidatus Micrarchaeia archaeon]|nr:hypothetical protein [Candidatus Micrarchaeia archaeon]
MLVVRALSFLGGALISAGTLGSVIRTVIIPRAVPSRLSSVLELLTERGAGLIANASRTYADRDRRLAYAAPSFLVVRLAAWIGLLVFGYALVLWPLMSASPGDALRLSASSLFPLGLATAQTALQTAVVFLETASGVIVVALQIAYLPTLYAAFNKRETLVTLLDSRSGSPPWGPEILARHALIDNLDSLAPLYADWEVWAADLAESHTSYTPLLYFRSPHPLRSWVLALLAVMDAAALQLALTPLSAPAPARPFLRMGIVCLRALCAAAGLPVVEDASPDQPLQLTESEFREAVARMTKAGWAMDRSPEEGWRHFRGWRVNYETMAYALARRVDAPPGPWSGTRRGRMQSSIVPVRPPHRAPSADTQEILALTRERQSRRRTGSHQHGAGEEPADDVRPAPGPR